MTTDKQYGNHVFECDTCSNEFHTGTGNFDAALTMLKREGWTIRKFGAEWKHFCSDKCKGAYQP